MIRILAHHALPWINLKINGDQVKVDGRFRTLFSYFENVFNVSLDLPKYGNRLDNILKMIISNESDVLLHPMLINENRANIYDVSSAIVLTYNKILSNGANEQNNDNFLSMNNVELHVWLILLMSLMGITVLYYVTDNVENRMYRFINDIKSAKKEIYKMLKYLLAFSAIFILQAIPMSRSPRCLGCRSLIFSWTFGLFIFVNILLSFVVSRLTINSQSEQIDSLDDILKYPKLIPYVHEGSEFAKNLERSSDPNIRRLWKKIGSHKSLIEIRKFSSKDVMKNILDRKAVAISYQQHLEYLSAAFCTNDTAFHFSVEKYFMFPACLIMRKGLPYSFRKKLNVCILTFHQNGFMIPVLKGPPSKASVCVASKLNHEDDQVKPLSTSELIVSLYVLTVGLGISTLVLVCFELFNCKKSQNKRHANTKKHLAPSNRRRGLSQRKGILSFHFNCN